MHSNRSTLEMQSILASKITKIRVQSETMRVLGIETSCDETGIALYDSEQGLLAHGLYSQVSIHAEFGGVVPELASRDHIRKTLPLIQKVLSQAQLSLQDLEGIAYTAGPGLMGALLVGASIGCSLGWALSIPSIAIHHMEGHLLAPLLEPNPPAFPFIALLISGGHTQLIEVREIGEYVLIGETLDDAIGEAFDKTAKLLGLGYPGGAALEVLAHQGDPNRYRFPRPMIDRPGLDFSFSGLKTMVSNTIASQREKNSVKMSMDSNHLESSHLSEKDKADIARCFQDAVIETLIIKCERALAQSGFERLLIAGGVSANQTLRQGFRQRLTERKGVQVYYARPEFCTDNGVMIAFAGCKRLLKGQSSGLAIQVRPRWEI